MIHNLSTTNSIFGTFLAELRDVNIQNDSLRFRRNLERMAEVMAYEISKTLAYKEVEVQTPLATINTQQLVSQPVLATILRAGLPMHTGLLNYFDRAENAFISAYRKSINDEAFEIFVEYMAAPSIEGKDLIICDPMLATGGSMLLSIEALLKQGTPKKLFIVAAIAAPEAIEYLQNHLSIEAEYYIGGIDKGLNSHSYIVPGLGDAGDLAYGSKT